MVHDLIMHIICQSLRLLRHAVASLNKVPRKAILGNENLQKLLSEAAKGPTKGAGLSSEDTRDLLRERTQDAKTLLGASKVALESKLVTTMRFEFRGDKQRNLVGTTFFVQPPLPAFFEGRFPQQGSQGIHQGKLMVSQPMPCSNFQRTFIEGNIQNCLNVVEQYTRDTWILQTVTGYKTPFTKPPHQLFPTPFIRQRQNRFHACRKLKTFAQEGNRTCPVGEFKGISEYSICYSQK